MKKMKDIVVDYRRAHTQHSPLTINFATVERVSSTKFLGVHITEDLSWTSNTAALAKKAQQHLYFHHKLRRARALTPIICTSYRGNIVSILTSCITVWYGTCNTSCRYLQHPPHTQTLVNLPTKLRASSVCCHQGEDYVVSRPRPAEGQLHKSVGRTLNRTVGCEFDGDGATRGFLQYHLDGKDFFSLDVETGNWTIAYTKAENFFTEWDPKGDLAKYWKNHLNNTCIERLKQFLHYRTDTEERNGTHTLQYFAAITPGINYTVGELDGEQFVYYGSNVTAVITKTQWIKKIDADEQDYWKSAKDRMSGELDNLQHLLTLAVKHFNHTEDSKDPSTDPHELVGAIVGGVIGVGVLIVLFVLIVIYMNNNSDPTPDSRCAQKLVHEVIPLCDLLPRRESGTEGDLQGSSV